jgi:predicted ATP-dependent endonuclease of OLD family
VIGGRGGLRIIKAKEMKLKTINIKNFKGLESVTLEDCGSVNAIVGKNNSGKSSVLHALDMAGLALSLRSWDHFQPKLEIKDLFADAGQFELSLTFVDDSTLSVTASPNFGPQIAPDPHDGQRFKSVLILPDVGSGMLRRKHRTLRNIIDCVEARDFGSVNAAEILCAIKFYAERAQRGFTQDSYDTLIEEVKRYFPDLEKIESDRTEHDIATLKYTEYGRQLDILYSGTGLKHFLDVLLKTTVSGARVVLLDEPELGLHPDLQRQFVEYLGRLAEEKRLQFFLATHSQVLLNYADLITYYRIVNTGGKRQLERVEESAIDTLLSDLGLRPSDVLNQDICLLVEGASDVIFFEHIIRNVYCDEFDRVAISVLQYGGGAADGIISGSIDVSNIVPVQKYMYWIRDRDNPANNEPNASATKFQDALRKQEIECHIWSKREIEFYYPDNVLKAAQNGDESKVRAVLEIKRGDQKEKFREAAKGKGICIPSGKRLRKLLEEHLKTKDDVDQEIREIIEKRLIRWRDEI